MVQYPSPGICADHTKEHTNGIAVAKFKFRNPFVVLVVLILSGLVYVEYFGYNIKMSSKNALLLLSRFRYAVGKGSRRQSAASQ